MYLEKKSFFPWRETILALIAFLINYTNLIPLSIFGAAPFFLIPICTGVSFFYGETVGLLFGLFCGVLADVLSPLVDCNDSFDAILSNPPYIPTADINNLSLEVHAEPFAALDGGKDGLLFYRAILKNYTPLLKKDGFFLFEIGFDQADALIALGKEHRFEHIRVIRDLCGNDRVVYLSNKPFDERSTSL